MADGRLAACAVRVAVLRGIVRRRRCRLQCCRNSSYSNATVAKCRQGEGGSAAGAGGSQCQGGSRHARRVSRHGPRPGSGCGKPAKPTCAGCPDPRSVVISETHVRCPWCRYCVGTTQSARWVSSSTGQSETDTRIGVQGCPGDSNTLAASSRSRHCRYWRWRPRVRRRTRWMSRARRSRWSARRAMSGCSPTKGHRWPRWSRPSQKTTALRAASRSAAWPACCGRSAAPTTRGAPCLLEHLATLTRDQVRFVGTRAAVPVLAEPTSAQR